MENVTINIFGGILILTPLILLIIQQVTTEAVSKFIREYFKLKSDKKARTLFYKAATISLVIGVIIMVTPHITIYFQPENEIQEANQPKSDSEVIVEGVFEVSTFIEEAVENKKEKNKEIIANREKRFVYQIGDIKDNKKSILKLYLKLKNIPSVDISRLFVFQLSKKRFFLYKNDEYLEDQINDSLPSFITQVATAEPMIKVIDLMQKCKVKQKITETKSFRFRKEEIEIPCCNCVK